MAASILREYAKEKGLEDDIQIDSAGIGDAYAGCGATEGSREAIRKMYGKDLLKDHCSKSISSLNLKEYDFIITMEVRHKRRLPKEKTQTLKEFVGEKGDIEDPIGQSQEIYDDRCKELRYYIEKAFGNILPSSAH